MSTFVVSWKEAAERNDSVASDALVIPRMTSSPLAGVPPSALICLFSCWSLTRSSSWPGSRSVEPFESTAHLLQHLAHDQLDVLVVDVDALGAVDLLHLGDQVLLGLGPAADLEDLGRERASPR